MTTYPWTVADEKQFQRQLDNNELVARQESELALLNRKHIAEMDKLRARQAQAVAATVRKHAGELLELWRSQKRAIGPGLERAGGDSGKTG